MRDDLRIGKIRNNMVLYDKISDLSLKIDNVELKKREKQVSENFTRKTTIVKLKGKEETGRGEDVIYEPEKHRYRDLDIEGEYSFQEFSNKIKKQELFPENVEHDKTDYNYRLWAIQSAALDLALKQNQENLAKALGKKYNPVTFLVSPSMNKPSIEKLQHLIKLNSDIEFKLDASTDWTQEFIEKLAKMDRVKVVDLKGQYKKENVKMEPNPQIYQDIAEGLPKALLEDPLLNEKTRKALTGHEERITWDKPFTSVKSIKELPFEPEVLNIKPSRFGTIKSLFDTIEYCQENEIKMYGGGQFELDVGREHIHTIASLFYADSPNDVAPRTYNQESIPENPPKSPLKPKDNLEGLEWRYTR